MRKKIALLCLLLTLCLFNPLALAEPLVFTGASGFTLTLPGDWETLFGGDDEDGSDYLEPGMDEAHFCSPDMLMTVTVKYPDETPVDPNAVGALLAESTLESQTAMVHGYQKLYYRFDEPNRRAFLTYSYVDSEDGLVWVEYLVGFLAASDELQFFTVTVRGDQHEDRFQLIGGIVNSVDVGAPREGAEG